MVALDDDADAARRGAARFLGGTYRQDFDPLVDHVAAAGDLDDVGERLQAFVDAGARHLIVCPIHGDPAAAADRLLAEVVPHLG
jgi:alkanesulfonate monooxygenase SsuD/methylene tetrahydromethanopterin reductase-like flavin-dependent oxidoreductase (luciferase family)